MGYGTQIGRRMMQHSQLKRMLNLLKIIMVMMARVMVTTGNIIPQTQTTVADPLHRVHRKDLGTL